MLSLLSKSLHAVWFIAECRRSLHNLYQERSYAVQWLLFWAKHVVQHQSPSVSEQIGNHFSEWTKNLNNNRAGSQISGLKCSTIRNYSGPPAFASYKTPKVYFFARAPKPHMKNQNPDTYLTGLLFSLAPLKSGGFHILFWPPTECNALLRAHSPTVMSLPSSGQITSRFPAASSPLSFLSTRSSAIPSPR